MRCWVIALLLLLVGPAAPGQDASAGFALQLPAAVGDVSSWETITGRFETTRARGSYLFYVNPRRQGIYQLMRYRVELLGATDPRSGGHTFSERVAFVRNPGTREPLLCWRLQPGGSGLFWHSLTPGSEEYQHEMATLMQVLAVHRRVRNAQRH